MRQQLAQEQFKALTRPLARTCMPFVIGLCLCLCAPGLRPLARAQEPGDRDRPIFEANPTPVAPSELSLFEDIPMVVTVSRKPERVTETPSIISVITAADIERMGARTIMDVLRTIPGIDLRTDHRNVSQMTVRGLRSETSSGVKILIDGHALNDPFTGGATIFYADLPLRNVRRIEIIRGPASSVYGANAFVSVINILTKDAGDLDGLHVALYGDTVRTLSPSFQWGAIINELKLALSLDYLTSEGEALTVSTDLLSVYDQAVAGQYPPISLAPGHVRTKRERVDGAFEATYRDFTLHGHVSEKTWGPFLTSAFALNHETDYTTRHFYTALNFQRFFTQRLEIQGRLYGDGFSFQGHEQFARGLRLPSLFREGETYVYPTGIITASSGDSWRIGGEYFVNYRISARNDLTIGAAYEYLTIDNFEILTNEQNFERDLPPDILYPLDELLPDVRTSAIQTVFSVFAHDKWRVRRNIDLTLGLRGDFFSNFGGVATPKVGITYRPDPRVNLKAIFGSAFRVPAFYETFRERESQGSAARNALVVESLGTFEIGVGYKPWEWVAVDMNIFSTEIRQLAQTADGDDDDDLRFTPIGSERVYGSIGGIDVEGVEFELRGAFEHNLEFGLLPRVVQSSFRLNYTYQEARDSKTDDPMPYLAGHAGNVDLGLKFSSVNTSTGTSNLLRLLRSLSDEFSLHAHAFLSGSRPRAATDVRDALPAYALLDLTFVAHDVLKPGLDLSCSVRNLFDTVYRDPGPEFAPVGPQHLVLDDYPNPGRMLFVELRYRF